MILQTITYYLFGRTGLTPGMAQARYKASRRAGGLCELSGQGGMLHAHHMFNVAHFPWFSTYAWNLIMIRPELHTSFHAWRGGTDVWCTPLHLYYWWYTYKQPYKFWAFVSIFAIATWEFYQWL